ncbi:hypothetical protein CCACVL1_30696 [Corchorus capsularis]|uniref:Uncharacterized protein n=1 Tax=Corchorus capsularis TaxID=210143 RepID=A0A1R3FW89_COCAP|nr:hypothetical protein CCACVL1_30696 [Corchorus capsularis]
MGSGVKSRSDLESFGGDFSLRHGG